jgi:hypothetical protein
MHDARDKAPDARPDAPQAPEVGGVRAGPRVAAALYVLLIASAAFALWVRRGPTGLPIRLELAAPWVFLAFVVLFAIYRFALVRAGQYTAFKAFFQIGIALLFFTLLLPGAKARFEPPSREIDALLADVSPKVRLLAAELARYRPERQRYVEALIERLGDPEKAVRAEAHRSLVAITGEDFGKPEGDVDAVKRAWREGAR